MAQSNKGVFITTSYFTKGALEYAENLNGTINGTINGTTAVVLMNGQQLANYIYDYNLGMDSVKTITIKKLDTDFWDLFTDEVNT